MRRPSASSTGICDTLCFKLFDQTPHAWAKVHAWAGKKGEFQVEIVVIDDPVTLTDTILAGTLHAAWASADMLPLMIQRLQRDPRAMPRIYQQVDWSNGGHAIVGVQRDLGLRRDPAILRRAGGLVHRALGLVPDLGSLRARLLGGGLGLGRCDRRGDQQRQGHSGHPLLVHVSLLVQG